MVCALLSRFSQLRPPQQPQQQSQQQQQQQHVPAHRVQMQQQQQASIKNRRLAQQMANRPNVQTALKLKVAVGVISFHSLTWNFRIMCFIMNT